jgi:predicted MFS family arabinose efflux permease
MTPSPDRLFTPAFVALTLSELAYFTSAGLVIGVTPFFVTGPLGSDEAGLGLVAGAFGVTTLLLRPWAGRTSDRRGRRPLLLAGSSLFAVVVMAHALGPGFEALVALRLILGVAEAMFFVAGYAALADLAPAGRAGEALSYNSLALYLGVALGPFVGQLLMDAGGFPLAWSGGAVLALVATLLALRIPETATRLGEPPTGSLIHRAAIGPGAALFTGVAAMAGFLLLAGPYAERLGLDAWSVTFLVFGGTVVLLRVTLARLPDRVPPLRLGAAALGMCATGLALVAAWPGFAGLMTGTIILASGVAFMTPALFAATFARVVPGERGAAAGTATLFIDLGFAGGPLLVGYAAASAGTPFALGVGAGIALVGALATVAAVARTARARQPGQRPAASESARGSAPPS